MAMKILAGLAAALLVTGAGVYVAFSGDAPRESGSETLTVSEGSCCAAKARLACEAAESDCPGRTCSPDVLAACTGPAVLAASAGTPVISCCQE
ncbi:MAG TPA: hypothetical protein VM533_04635 [Fimbriiglobus sp.]|jgi:hypothetical protein|nr:hypothetical protein [Fimbriiglobus sp.]